MATKKKTNELEKLSATKPETFKLEPIEKFEKPVRELPPIEMPKSAAVEEVKKKKILKRMVIALLAVGIVGISILVFILTALGVESGLAFVISLGLFIGSAAMYYSFMEPG